MSVAAFRTALIDRFVLEATAAGAVVHGPVPAAESSAIVKGIADEMGVSAIFAWHDSALGVPDSWQQLGALGITIVSPVLPAGKAERFEVLAGMDLVDIGLTSADAALADTGTLVMGSGPDRPRLAWLLPARHVALVQVDNVLPDMATFFADPDRATLDRIAHLAFVTGPSRTGDIELTLTRGVHGPKTVDIVLVERGQP